MPNPETVMGEIIIDVIRNGDIRLGKQLVGRFLREYIALEK